MNLKYIFGIIAVGALGLVIGGWWGTATKHKANIAGQITIGRIGLVGQGYIQCSPSPEPIIGAPPRTSGKATVVISKNGVLIVGCDGDPVGSTHYQGRIYTRAQQATVPPPCMSGGLCQINAEFASGIFASPSPTCPPSQECISFTSPSLRDITDDTELPASGIVVVSTSGLANNLGNSEYGSYVQGKATTTWQNPFTVCPRGSGSCVVDLYLQTSVVPSPAAVTPCSGGGECLSYNGTRMNAVNEPGTLLNAAMTIQMVSSP